MAHFEADVQLQDLSEVDALTARKVVEERLGRAGIQRWKVLRIGPPPAIQKPRPRPLVPPIRGGIARARARTDIGQGAWVVIAALTWGLWFVWLLNE